MSLSTPEETPTPLPGSDWKSKPEGQEYTSEQYLRMLLDLPWDEALPRVHRLLEAARESFMCNLRHGDLVHENRRLLKVVMELGSTAGDEPVDTPQTIEHRVAASFEEGKLEGLEEGIEHGRKEVIDRLVLLLPSERWEIPEEAVDPASLPLFSEVEGQERVYSDFPPSIDFDDRTFGTSPFRA